MFYPLVYFFFRASFASRFVVFPAMPPSLRARGERDGVLRSFMTVSVECSARRRVARSPVSEHRGLQRALGEMVASFVSAREKDIGSKVRLQRVCEYIRTFFGHGVRHRQEDDEADTFSPRSAPQAEVRSVMYTASLRSIHPFPELRARPRWTAPRTCRTWITLG